MIPKVINYVWIGNKEIPERELTCIKTWHEILPDYTFNFFTNDYLDSLTLTPLMQRFKKRGRWAFLSDYVRLKVMKDNPGIYLDTDIFMLKPFTEEMHSQSFFAGMGEEDIINQGVMGFDGSSTILDSLISHYESLSDKFEQSPMEYTPQLCNYIGYDGEVGVQSPTLRFENKRVIFYSRDYFYPIHWSGNSYKRKKYLHTNFTDNTVCIHLWSASAQPRSNYESVNHHVRNVESLTLDFINTINPSLNDLFKVAVIRK